MIDCPNRFWTNDTESGAVDRYVYCALAGGHEGPHEGALKWETEDD
ncbi:hypothetical protein [Kineosporia sp. NBRC 101731]|nr:hypothetical protein [Kineosporia sp. NBRC 101731]GLY32095.1 hypothetical protein Kisp02_54600 [Kineosporia sp. NBRC 101731]